MRKADVFRPAGVDDGALVWGLGESGAAAARLLRAAGWNVVVAEDRRAPAAEARAAALAPLGVRVAWSVTAWSGIRPALVVLSPGVPPGDPRLTPFHAAGVPVRGEFELGAHFARGPLVAVTGSSGKSSIVKLLAETLRAAGRPARPCGNYGEPLSAAVAAAAPAETLVAEASSFQLETVRRLPTCAAALLLNLHPNHLDRHGTWAAYEAAKLRLFAAAPEAAAVVIPAAWRSRLRREYPAAAARAVTFAAEPDDAADFRRGADGVLYRGAAPWARLTGSYFDNPVLGVNAAGAAAVCAALDVPAAALEQAARDFRPLPHRRQLVGEYGGVRFVDDSKATTLDALTASVRMCGGPVRLIAGGLLKEDAPERVKDLLASDVRMVYLIGSCAQTLRAAWSDSVPCRVCGDLAKATAEACREARPGETVLLAPGCASFDQFVGYHERGEQFAQRVKGYGDHEATGRFGVDGMAESVRSEGA